MKCQTCKTEFEPSRSWQKFCSPKCNYTSRRWGTDKQREWVSGNWRRYLNRLLTSNRERKSLTIDDLLELLEEQNGRCALTGVALTNILVKDRKIWTNASIDRIVSGGPYIRSNVQLVCTAVNSFRSQMSIEEFRQWCSLVAKFRGLRDGKRSKLPRRVPDVPRKARAEEKPRAAKRRAAGDDGSRTRQEGRRQGRRPQAPNSGGGKQLSVKSPRYFGK